MAKDTKQLAESQISEVRQQADYLKNEKLSPEREKRLLAEVKRAIRIFKEIEARSKRGERYQVVLKNFKELQNLNNRILKTEVLENEANKNNEIDKNSISMEMAWAQVDGKVLVTFEEMASSLRSTRKKEFFDKLKYDTELKRDLVGMTEVVKHIRNREFNKALAAMIYFGVENRMHEMESFFNVTFDANFKNQVESTFKFAKEQGLNEFQMKDAASQNMRFADGFLNKSKASLVSAMTGENVNSFHVAVKQTLSVSDVIGSAKSSLEDSIKSLPFGEEKRRKDNSDYYLIKKDYMPGLLLKINMLDVSIIKLRTELDAAIKSGDTLKQEEIKQKLNIAEETKKKLQTRYDNLKKLPAYAYHEAAEAIREIKALEDRRNKLASDPSKAAEVLRLDKEIEEKYDRLDRILSGQEKVSRVGKLDPILDVRENKKAVKVEERNLKDQLYTETDPKKKKIIEARLSAAKAKKLELQAQDLENQGEDAIAGQEKQKERRAEVRENIIRTLDTVGTISQDVQQTTTKPSAEAETPTTSDSETSTKEPISQSPSTVESFEDVAVKLEHDIRSTYDQADFGDLLDEIGRGETNPEKLALLEKLKAGLSSSYIESFKNKRTLDEYISTFNSIDETNPEGKKEKQHIAQVVVQIISEKLKNFKFNVSEADVTHYENVINQIRSFYKKENSGIELSKLDQLIQEKKQSYAKKHEAISENDKTFEEISAHKEDENIINYIKAYFDKINTLPDPDKANYTEQEIAALENQFNSCEGIIAEKNLKGDEEFENAREQARKKVSEMRVRHKVFGILDTTELYSIKDRDQQINMLRENLKFLCECIDAGTLDPHNINRIAHLNVEYRKLKALLMTDDDRLKDIEEMLQKVADWEYETEKGNQKFYTALKQGIDKVYGLLSQASALINKPNLSQEDIMLLLACKANMKNLKKNYTVDPRFFKEINELYEKLEPKIEEASKINVNNQLTNLISMADSLLESEFDGSKINQFNALKSSVDSLKSSSKKYIDSKLLFELDIKMKKCEAKAEHFKAGKQSDKSFESENQEIQNEEIESEKKGYSIAGVVDSDELYEESKRESEKASDPKEIELINAQIEQMGR